MPRKPKRQKPAKDMSDGELLDRVFPKKVANRIRLETKEETPSKEEDSDE